MNESIHFKSKIHENNIPVVRQKTVVAELVHKIWRNGKGYPKSVTIVINQFEKEISVHDLVVCYLELRQN